MNRLRNFALRRRLNRARRAFRQNYIEWKRTGCTASRYNVTILAERLRSLERRCG